MRKYKALILPGVTLIIALATSVMAYNWLQEKANGPVQETIMVAVAAADLSWGTPLSKEMIRTASMLKNALPSGYYSDPKLLDGRVVISAIKGNEPIIESRLAPRGIASGGVAAVISQDKRAMAIHVDKVKGVSGFIHPGNRVDVLVSLRRTGQGDSNPFTKTILQNILVLAVGTEMENKSKQGKPSPVDVITLEVSPEEAEVLALAAAEGKTLQLALRNYGDTKNVATRGANISTMLASGHVEVPQKTRVIIRKEIIYVQKAEAEPPKMQMVEIIRGSTVNEVQVKGGE